MLRSGRNGVDVFLYIMSDNSRAVRAKTVSSTQWRACCTFRLYTAQIRSVEIGYIDNRRNGVDI